MPYMMSSSRFFLAGCALFILSCYITYLGMAWGLARKRGREERANEGGNKNGCFCLRCMELEFMLLGCCLF